MNLRCMKKSRIFLIMALVLTLVFGVVQSASASSYEADKKGSVTVNLKDIGTPRDGGQLLLYQVGTLEYETELSYTLTEALASTGVELNAISTTEALAGAAEKLKTAVAAAGLTPVNKVTDASGSVKFADLAQGVYLLTEAGGSQYGVISPLLLYLPYLDGENTWVYEIEALPKAAASDRKGQIEITKKISYINENLDTEALYAEDATYYAGLFYDAAGTIPYQKDAVKPIRIVKGSSGKVSFTGLPKGTYYVLETDAKGKPIQPNTPQVDAEGNDWMCQVVNNNSGNSRVELDPAQSTGQQAVIENIYYDIPSHYGLNAELSITKKVLKDNTPATVQDTFYAGIFIKDKKGTLELIKTTELTQNGKVTLEVPLGGETGKEDVSYTVLETDKKGDPVDKDVFAYTVKGEGNVKLTAEKRSGAITITNILESGPTPEPTVTETPDGTGSSGGYPSDHGTTGAGQVKTGDHTPVAFYAVLLLAAASIAAGIIRKKKTTK